jgi:hypothetical protein
VEVGAGNGVDGLELVRILRLFRVFRIFKLGKHSAGLQIFAMALKRSQRILIQLFVFVVTVSTVFSAVIYYLEFKQTDTSFQQFDSIPRCMWWAVVTMTTVGYGDMVPFTVGGKLVGIVCALSGILVISLPIPVFVKNFGMLWEEHLLRSKHEKAIAEDSAFPHDSGDDGEDSENKSSRSKQRQQRQQHAYGTNVRSLAGNRRRHHGDGGGSGALVSESEVGGRGSDGRMASRRRVPAHVEGGREIVGARRKPHPLADMFAAVLAENQTGHENDMHWGHWGEGPDVTIPAKTAV